MYDTVEETITAKKSINIKVRDFKKFLKLKNIIN
tara:strand:- start:76 stop:177 length:102 start_codon:yes stop_codon:yes gene_type:complete